MKTLCTVHKNFSFRSFLDAIDVLQDKQNSNPHEIDTLYNKGEKKC